MNRFLGVAMILFALVLAIAPAFTDCESQGKMVKTADGRQISMKCHWAGIAEVAAAIPLAVAGAYTIFARRRESLRLAGIVGLSAGIAAILLPTLLIGTCTSLMMPCNVVMKPIVLASGILASVASLAVFVLAREPRMAAAGAAA